MFQIEICWNISSIRVLANQLLCFFVRSTIDTARNCLLSSVFLVFSVIAISKDQALFNSDFRWLTHLGTILTSVFIDEDESTWDSWRIKLNDKLQTNVNHFINKIICIVYVISRLENNAAEHIFTWHHHDALHSYISIYELLKHLEEIYEDQNKNQKCCCKYNVLRQADKLFNIFYFNFMKLFSYLDYDDCTLMNDLQNKINNHLQNALSICLKDFITLHHLKSFLQSVNNRQRVNYQLQSKRCMIIVKVIIASEKRVTSLSAVMISIIEYVKSIIFSTSESVRSSIVCYICKISDHLFKNCFQNKINISASCVFTFRLHEIIISKNKENEKMTFFFENSEAKN